MKLILGLAAALGLMMGAGQVQAVPPVDGGTLTLLTASPSLGNIASFEYTLSGQVRECPNGGTSKCARIQVVCSQPVTVLNPDGIVYGEALPAMHPTSFLLGGASSEWLSVGGAAECVATLYYWDFHPSQTFVPLATVAFNAGG